ncbi:hypothetical protein IFM89_010289 [Coptis chinensis]|uniref:Protein FAR1-RELATED SEQUENCE n=1 Tax=Coptis chinensis TaxID=261450 RepID=A0A835H2C4_9MAGN|nr:hypothetical protein IFM89_010289 [Coptis chinensis]
MEDVEGEDCEVLHSTLGSKNNISNVKLKPTLSMKFSSFEDAKDFYNCHDMQKGFGTKIKNSYNKKNTDQRQMANVYTRAMFLKFQKEVYSMPSCSKSQVRVDGQITTFEIKEQDLKRKLVDESNNSDSVEDELVGTHPSESPESVQPGYVKFLNPLQAKRVGRPKVTTVPKSSNHKATNKNVSSHDTCGNEHNITQPVSGKHEYDGIFASYPPVSSLANYLNLDNYTMQVDNIIFLNYFYQNNVSQAPHVFSSTNNNCAIPLSSQFDLNKSQWVCG